MQERMISFSLALYIFESESSVFALRNTASSPLPLIPCYYTGHPHNLFV